MEMSTSVRMKTIWTGTNEKGRNMSQWNERNSSDWMKPNQRDHFSEGVRFSRWIEDVKSEEIYREQQERKDNEKHRDTEGSAEDSGQGTGQPSTPLTGDGGDKETDNK